MYYRVNIKDNNRTIRLESGSGSAPAAIGGSWTNLGSFEHNSVNDAIGPEVSHLLVTDLEDFLRHSSAFDEIDPDLRVDISAINITKDVIRSISIGSGTISVSHSAGISGNITATPTPALASKRDLIWEIADPTKADILHISEGVVQVKGKVAGSTTISCTDPATEVTISRAITVT